MSTEMFVWCLVSGSVVGHLAAYQRPLVAMLMLGGIVALNVMLVLKGHRIRRRAVEPRFLQGPLPNWPTCRFCGAHLSPQAMNHEDACPGRRRDPGFRFFA